MPGTKTLSQFIPSPIILGKQRFSKAELQQRVETQKQNSPTIIFNQMKGATGEEGKYGVLDHVRFRVLLPLKSVFGLTSEEKQQKDLYHTASKVKAASASYFARSKELALDYKKAKIEMSKRDPDGNKAQIKYWKNINLDDLEKLQAVRKTIEEDPKSRQASLKMLSGFKEWMTLVNDPSDQRVDDKVVAKARENLLAEIDDGQKGDSFLQAIRVRFAHTLLKSFSITPLIDNFEKFVQSGVFEGLGSEREVRETFIQVAGYVVNHSNSSFKAELETYFQNLEAAQHDYEAPISEIQDQFKSQIVNLINGEEFITARTLGSLSYKDDEWQGGPIFLRGFFNEDQEGLEDLADHLEGIRHAVSSLKDQLLTLDEETVSIKTLRNEIEDMNNAMGIFDKDIFVKELADIPEEELPNAQLQTILNDQAAGIVIRCRAWLTLFNEVCAKDKGLQALIEEEAKLTLEVEGIKENHLAAIKELDDLLLNIQQHQLKLDETRQNRSGLFNSFNNTEGIEQDGVAKQIEFSNVNVEILQDKTNVLNRNKISLTKKIEQFKKSLEDKSDKLNTLKENIKNRDKEIFEETARTSGANPKLLEIQQVKISTNGLVQLENCSIKESSSLSTLVTQALEMNSAMADQQDNFREEEEFLKSQNRLAEQTKKNLENRLQTALQSKQSINYQQDAEGHQVIDLALDLGAVIQNKTAEELYKLHQLSLYQAKLRAVTDIITEVEEQNQIKLFEAQVSLGTAQLFKEHFNVKITDLGNNSKEAQARLQSKISDESLKTKLQAIHASKYFQLQSQKWKKKDEVFSDVASMLEAPSDKEDPDDTSFSDKNYLTGNSDSEEERRVDLDFEGIDFDNASSDEG